VDIFKYIGKTNVPTLVVSLFALSSLYIVKHFINEKFKEKLIAPLPIELVVIVLTTLFSYLLDFNKKWHIAIVGKIPLGIPAPKLPNFSLVRLLVSDSFNIAIVSFAINISMGKLFAKKYNYNINANQVFLRLGEL
jgi:MFS superfamily sulfate permease-like transporter